MNIFSDVVSVTRTLCEMDAPTEIQSRLSSLLALVFHAFPVCRSLLDACFTPSFFDKTHAQRLVWIMLAVHSLGECELRRRLEKAVPKGDDRMNMRRRTTLASLLDALSKSLTLKHLEFCTRNQITEVFRVVCEWSGTGETSSEGTLLYRSIRKLPVHKPPQLALCEKLTIASPWSPGGLGRRRLQRRETVQSNQDQVETWIHEFTETIEHWRVSNALSLGSIGMEGVLLLTILGMSHSRTQSEESQSEDSKSFSHFRKEYDLLGRSIDEIIRSLVQISKCDVECLISDLLGGHDALMKTRQSPLHTLTTGESTNQHQVDAHVARWWVFLTCLVKCWTDSDVDIPFFESLEEIVRAASVNELHSRFLILWCLMHSAFAGNISFCGGRPFGRLLRLIRNHSSVKSFVSWGILAHGMSFMNIVADFSRWTGERVSWESSWHMEDNLISYGINTKTRTTEKQSEKAFLSACDRILRALLSCQRDSSIKEGCSFPMLSSPSLPSSSSSEFCELPSHFEDAFVFFVVNENDPQGQLALCEEGIEDISRCQCWKEIKEAFDHDIVGRNEKEKETPMKRRKLMEDETTVDEEDKDGEKCVDKSTSLESLLTRLRHGHRMPTASSLPMEYPHCSLWHRRLIEEMHDDRVKLSSVLRDYPIYPNGIEVTHRIGPNHDSFPQHRSPLRRSEMSPTLEARVGMRSVVRWEWFLSSLLASPVHSHTDFREIWGAIWSLHQACATSTIRDRTQTQLCLISTHIPMKFLVGWFEGVLQMPLLDKMMQHHDSSSIHESRQHATSAVKLIADFRFDPFIRSICVQDAWFYVWMMWMWQKHSDDVDETWELLCKVNRLCSCKGMIFANCFVDFLRVTNLDDDSFDICFDELETVLSHHQYDEILITFPFEPYPQIRCEGKAVKSGSVSIVSNSSSVGIVALRNTCPAIRHTICLLFAAALDKCNRNIGNALHQTYFELLEKTFCKHEASPRVVEFCLKIVQEWRQLMKCDSLPCYVEGMNDVEMFLHKHGRMKLSLQSSRFSFAPLDTTSLISVKDERKGLEIEDLFSEAIHAAEGDINDLQQCAQPISDNLPLDETLKGELADWDIEGNSDESCEDDVILL
eukprot:TRINITY_DN23617_c0_g1_i1.p1 TRINITY_DN23617_c0_g1~~TRINITY_DN23617_c0_g1_i1.p1  ORF type:complete len:1105 (-),score=248.34 TRINITY_DN23617_c0_g1_i1:47-3361(-)